MERENYYLMLELPIDPPTEDPGEIRSAIHRKKQEWTRWQDHPGKRAQGLANLAALPDLEQVMFDPVARKREACRLSSCRGNDVRFEAELRILEEGPSSSRGSVCPVAPSTGCTASPKKIHELVRVPVSEEPPTPKNRSCRVRCWTA